MAIDINKPGKNRIELPLVKITGNLVNSDTGSINSNKSEESFGDNDVEQNGLVVKHRSETIFRDTISVEITPDPNYKAEAYGYSNLCSSYEDVTRSTNTVVGKKPSAGSGTTYSSGTTVNEKSNTYYSLNGKDPLRTKVNLYTGPFTIKRNTSGTDNIILKARTYVQGLESKVIRVDLKIISHDSNLV